MLGPKTELVLQKFTLVPDNMGGFLETWQAKRKMKGILLSLSGRERFITGKTEAYRTHKFMVDYPKNLIITEKDRFALGSRTFDIKSIADPAEQHIHLEIDLLEIT